LFDDDAEDRYDDEEEDEEDEQEEEYIPEMRIRIQCALLTDKDAVADWKSSMKPSTRVPRGHRFNRNQYVTK
jgi:hypothetical protein